MLKLLAKVRAGLYNSKVLARRHLVVVNCLKVVAMQARWTARNTICQRSRLDLSPNPDATSPPPMRARSNLNMSAASEHYLLCETDMSICCSVCWTATQMHTVCMRHSRVFVFIDRTPFQNQECLQLRLQIINRRRNLYQMSPLKVGSAVRFHLCRYQVVPKQIILSLQKTDGLICAKIARFSVKPRFHWSLQFPVYMLLCIRGSNQNMTKIQLNNLFFICYKK